MVEKARTRPNRGARSASLNREQALYEANLSRWLADHEGEYVLIKGDQVDGFYGIPRRSPVCGLRAVRDRVAIREAGLAIGAGLPYPQRDPLMPLIRVPIGIDGPIIDLGIWMARPMAHAYIARGLVVPPPQTIRALIDTGADRTAIHPNALALVASAPSGTIRVRRPGQAAARRVNLHDVRLAFGGAVVSPTRGPWIELESAAVVPADPSVLALIGRDMLAHCQFVYDGLKCELLLVC